MANQLVPSSSFSSTPSWTYDVFLSFRGEDTRTNFTDHLYHALVRHGINTFIDHRELPTGEEISPTLLEAIEKSRISVIVFSENYASSRWCLDELVHILECRKSKGQMTRPIFYKVDPSDARHQRNSYGAAFADHSRKYENDLEKVQRWRIALTKAANLKGATLNEGEYETTFIKSIVEEISIQVLNRTYLNTAKYPVGIQSCAEEVKELLGVQGKGGCVVGIWGTSGIGKTAIAKAVYNAIAHMFQGSCFLADVRELSTSREGIIKLQKSLLSKVLRGKKLKIDDVHLGISLIKKRFRQKKILLILDDVDRLEQLNNLVDVNWFGNGSRVIITTKDRGLLDSYGVQLIYEVQKLEDDKALELFSLNAFGRKEPSDDYLSLARRAIAYAQGLPLALNLIGSHLRNKSICRWQAILDSYESYEGEPYRGIQRTLQKSYDAWDYAMQQVFLDIACFFKGENKDYVLQILRSSKLNVPQDCIEFLVENAIITIEDNRILMHDLLEKMGKHIVYEESPNEPGKRSRLWFHEDVYNVLTENQGTKKIKGIVLELPKPDVIPLNAKSFLRMVNLEFFINRNACFSGRVDYLPNGLRWIDLGGGANMDQKHTVVLNLQPNFHPRHLVSFDVSYSGIRQLKGFKNLAKLTSMNLSGCEFLKKIPDLSGIPNIKHLDLSMCKNLVKVDDSVAFLDKLEKWNLCGCSKLTRLATRLGLKSLRELHLSYCTRLETFPEIEENKMKSLYSLSLSYSGIRELPSSIAYLNGLHFLGASCCQSLVEIPQVLPPKLNYLHLNDCTSLDKIPKLLPMLQHMDLTNCLRLSGDEVARLENNLLNQQESLILSKLEVMYPGNEVPKWFSYISDHPTTIEFPLEGLPWEETTFGLPVEEYDWEETTTGLPLEEYDWEEKTTGLPLEEYDWEDTTTGLPLEEDDWEEDDWEETTFGLPLEEYDWEEKTTGLPLEEYDWEDTTTGLPPEEYDWEETTSGLPPEEDDWEETTIGFPLEEDDWEEEKEFFNDTTIELVREREFSFEIPLNLQVGESLLGLALSFVYQPWAYCPAYTSILINGIQQHGPRMWGKNDSEATHVWLKFVYLSKLEQRGDICQVIFRFPKSESIKTCGVHLLLRNQKKRLPLTLGATSSLGKRPRPGGSSDVIDDE